MKKYHCYLCKKYKNKRHFFKDKSRCQGVASKCKLCQDKKRQARRYKKHRNDILKRQKEYRKNHPIETNARMLFSVAVKNGLIKRKPCKICRNKKSVGHHFDYSKPLEVIWLCQHHHQKLHYKLNHLPSPKREDK